MRSVALASLLLAACWSSPTPTAPANAAAPTAPATPAPVVGVATASAEAFSTVRLPAVSRDGSRVLLAIQDGDGGRGYPNLRLELRDRDDRIVATHVVLAADDAGGYLGDPALRATLAPRLDAANAWLAEQHRALAFEPLTALHVAPDPDYGPSGQHVASAGDVTLDWHDMVLTVGGAAPIKLAPPRREPAPPGPTVDGVECSNSPFLKGAAVDLAHHVVVIEVAYTGTDTCWEPNNDHTVVVW